MFCSYRPKKGKTGNIKKYRNDSFPIKEIEYYKILKLTII